MEEREGGWWWEGGSKVKNKKIQSKE